MQPLTQIIATALAELESPPAGFCVAFSGGRDSTVLLHALRELKPGPLLRAVHVDHGLQSASPDWARHCEALCQEWGIPCHVEQVSVNQAAADGGLEAAAREARYTVLHKALRPGECLLTAHHASDQLETVLLRLMRGGGPAGVAGIRCLASFGEGWLLRPLLQATVAQLADYSLRHRLRWIEDPSNEDEGLERNYLRHQVIPALQRHWPAAAETATRTARLADEAAILLDELAECDAAQAVDGDTIKLEGLAQLNGRRQKNLLRWYLRQHDVSPPSAASLEEGLGQLLHARADSAPRLSWPGGELRRYRDRLYLLRCHPEGEPVPAEREWDGRAPLELGPLAGQLSLKDAAESSACLRGAPLSVRFRRGGERLLQHGQHVSLKSLYQQGGILPWMRPHVPLVFSGEQLLTVGGLWYAQDRYSQGAVGRLEFCWAPGERLR